MEHATVGSNNADSFLSQLISNIDSEEPVSNPNKRKKSRKSRSTQATVASAIGMDGCAV